jgi:hypothetical protein
MLRKPSNNKTSDTFNSKLIIGECKKICDFKKNVVDDILIFSVPCFTNGILEPDVNIKLNQRAEMQANVNCSMLWLKNNISRYSSTGVCSLEYLSFNIESLIMNEKRIMNIVFNLLKEDNLYILSQKLESFFDSIEEPYSCVIIENVAEREAILSHFESFQHD